MDSADSSNKTWSVKFRVPLSIKPINSFQNKLPIINTPNDLMRSGDKIRRIEAVLSKTLNFVFNNYDGSRSFSTVVKQAQTEGYAEPDPRLDLSGTDVARKILILAREAGFKMEMSDIENISFLPESCLQGSVEDFYTEMATRKIISKICWRRRKVKIYF